MSQQKLFCGAGHTNVQEPGFFFNRGLVVWHASQVSNNHTIELQPLAGMEG